MDAALPLDRHGLLGRFSAPVELEYRRWLGLRIRSLGVAMSSASLCAWLTIPVAIDLSLTVRDQGTVYLVCWGLFVPVLVLCLVYIGRSRVPDWYVPLGTLATALSGLGTLLLLGPALGVEATVYLGTGTFFGSIAPLVLLPFRVTLGLGSAIAAASAFKAVTEASGDWDLNLSVMTVGMVFATLLVGPAMAFATERWLRTSFANEVIIDRQRQLIRRYAPSSVVSHIEQGDATVDAPQRRKVTVFFSDVVGFTTMADRVDPEALAEIVNDYLGNLADLIERHGGTLNEFAGDGVMAIFGAPDAMDPTEQVRAAVAAAQDLQRLLPAWSQGWYQHGIIDDAQARIGINTGTVSVGTFGSSVRATYTGIGLQTNIAARVQSEAKPGGILLSNTSWHLVKDTLPCEPRGEVMVKGVHFPIELYEPV